MLLVVASVPAHGEDLMDAYRQAVANDPVLATADARRLQVAEGVPLARSELLPQLSAGLGLQQVSGGGSRTTTDANGNLVTTGASGHTRSRSFTGNLSQPIIDLSAFADLRAAHASSDAQEQTYRAALQNLYVRVATAYFQVLVAQDSLRIDRAYENAYKQEYDQSEVRFKNGLAKAADVAQSKAYYLYIKSQRISAEGNLKDARRALEQITGHPTGTLETLREDLPMQAPKPDHVQAWIKAAKDTNPTVLAARYAVSSDEHRVNAARAEHLPTLVAGVGYNKFGSWSNTMPGTAAYGPATTTIGLTLRVPLFSGGATHAQVKQAIYQRDADRGQLETERRQAARDASNYFNLVVDGIEQVKSARDAVQAAKKALASMRAGYAVGTQSLTNVVVAIETLAQTQSGYSLVRHRFILNKLLLKQAAGSISVADLKAVNRLLQ
jgi:outer membrane protein